MESIGQLTATDRPWESWSQSLFLVSSTTMRMVAITSWECRAQAVAEGAVASNYGHTPGRNGCRRNNLDIKGDAPPFGQAHAGLFVLGVRAIHDEAFKPIGHDLVALLNVDREAPDIGHEYARTPRDRARSIRPRISRRARRWPHRYPAYERCSPPSNRRAVRWPGSCSPVRTGCLDR